MNFLAHLALAGPDDASRLGNLLGDFEKGTLDSLAPHFPPAVLAGIAMHRQLDRFTDSHPAFLQAKHLLAPHHRRFAGILIDIFFDHFLSLHWNQFHPHTPADFIQEIYQTFDRHPTWLGKNLAPLVPRIKTEDWLSAYADYDGLTEVLQRVSRRSHRLGPLEEAVSDLRKNQQSFAELFLAFYPAARLRASEILTLPPPSRPAFP
ncbi:MAG: ACP phosphodiesterase [Verrucomicrobiota bacterium]